MTLVYRRKETQKVHNNTKELDVQIRLELII